MSDEKEVKSDARFDYVCKRISSAFPKLAGQKLDKALAADEVK